ncbi:MAG: cytochrome C [Deltaproteobacteria bacterium]|nr:cytochrome C [Deltaproteobacteria bacterium]
MRKVLVGLTVVVSLVAVAAYAADNIVGTKHDLSSTTGNPISGDSTEVCVYCHTPHGAATSAYGPLWNRAYTVPSFTMYTSATINMTISAGPGPRSLACLSCHDGTTALGALVNGPGSGNGATNLGSTKITGTYTNLGTNLSNDHPIGIDYDNTKDTAFRAASSVTTNGLTLYNEGGLANGVECASCHKVHDNSYGMFLRKNNASSALCTTCHIK